MLAAGAGSESVLCSSGLPGKGRFPLRRRAGMRERRKHTRLPLNSLARVWILRKCREIRGTTADVCQGGAFVMSPGFDACQKDEEALVEMVLLPTTTGQEEELILAGPATVRRVDRDRGGIALQFSVELRRFERLR
jgi:hypothetical protein